MPVSPHAPTKTSPRLYLVTAPVESPAGLPADLDAVLAREAVAAVLLRLAPADERSLTNLIKTVAKTVQDAGTALIVAGHVELVGRAGADGAHLGDIKALQSALPHLKPDRIAGAGGLVTRHDAMTAAEAGADYVMFGEPDGRGQRPGFSAVLDRVEWWSPLFQVPCVGYADNGEEVDALVAAGAEFVAVGPWVFADPRGLGAALADLSVRLARGGAS
jgi:thiamine-phosphate pyrophosphorylase